MSKFNLVLDSQQINEYLTCPLKYYYKYQEHLRLATLDQKSAADKGTLVHHLMDLYYTMRALNPEKSKIEQGNCAVEMFKLNKVTESLFPDDPLTGGELEKFICDRFMLYVFRYVGDDFNVQVGKDGKPGVEVGFSNILFEDNEVRFVLEGRIDLLNIIGNTFSCWTDHKTEGKYNPLYNYKTQFRTYAVATGFEYGMVNYFGMQEDKKGELLKANKLFRRELIHFPNWMINEWKNRLISIYYDIYSHIKCSFDGSSMEEYFYEVKNESACSGAFDSHPCEFTHLCEEGNFEMKQSLKTFKYKKVEPWTPWKTMK